MSSQSLSLDLITQSPLQSDFLSSCRLSISGPSVIPGTLLDNTVSMETVVEEGHWVEAVLEDVRPPHWNSIHSLTRAHTDSWADCLSDIMLGKGSASNPARIR